MVNKPFKYVKCHKHNGFKMFLDTILAVYCTVYAMEETDKQKTEWLLAGRETSHCEFLIH
jgi:hypothetical protein